TTRELADDDILAVLAKEVRKRNEAAEVYAAAGRAELAGTERAEAAVLRRYLPEPLTDEELAVLVRRAVDEITARTGQPPTMRQMGQVVAAVRSEAGSRAQ